jgi:hypothetical protein
LVSRPAIRQARREPCAQEAGRRAQAPEADRRAAEPHPRDILRPCEAWLAVSTQPDVAFLGQNAFLTIECKIGSKSSLGQLLKYAALHAGAASAYPGRTHALLYLTPGGRETICRFPFADWADVKAQAIAALPGFRKGALSGLGDGERSEICNSLGLLHIGHCTYADLAGVIETARGLR